MPSAPLPRRRTGHPRPGAVPGRAVLVPVVLAAVATLGGCSATLSGGAASATGAGTATAAAYPVTVTRTGGLAGFDDHLVIADDGTVTGTTRAGAVSCRLDPDAAAALGTPLSAVPTTGTGPTTGPDSIVITVTGGGRTVHLGGSAGTDPLSQAVTALLNDVTRPADQRTVCR